MHEAIIAALELTRGNWERVWDNGVRTYVYRATVTPLTTVEEQLVELPANLFRTMVEAGFVPQIEIVIAHPDGEGGAGPTAQGIGQEQLQAIGGAYAKLTPWIGKRVVSGVEDPA